MTREHSRFSAWVGRVGDGAMPHGEHANDALVIVKLVDDPVSTNTQRPQPAKASSKGMPGRGLALEEAHSLDDCIREWPVERDDRMAGLPGEFDPAHLRVPTVELLAKLVQCHRLPTIDLLASLLDGDERVGIGEDLSGLFQGLVLVDRHEHRRRTASAGDNHMLAQIGDPIDDLAELAAKLADRHRLVHG